MCVGKIADINKYTGLCQKCGTKQKLERCRKTCVVRVIIEDIDHPSQKLTVSFFNDIVKKLTCCENEDDDHLDTETKLLCLDAKVFEINSNNVVVQVEDIPSVM